MYEIILNKKEKLTGKSIEWPTKWKIFEIEFWFMFKFCLVYSYHAFKRIIN